jgi:hypothetical protein
MSDDGAMIGKADILAAASDPRISNPPLCARCGQNAPLPGWTPAMYASDRACKCPRAASPGDAQRNPFTDTIDQLIALRDANSDLVVARRECVETFSRWSRQGHTDDCETPIDDYGKRILSMVIRELTRPSPTPQ